MANDNSFVRPVLCPLWFLCELCDPIYPESRGHEVHNDRKENYVLNRAGLISPAVILWYGLVQHLFQDKEKNIHPSRWHQTHTRKGET